MALTPLQENGARTSSTNCPDAELLAAFVDGRATPRERAEVEAHLARCEDCYFAFSETVREQQTQSATVSGESENPNRMTIAACEAGALGPLPLLKGLASLRKLTGLWRPWTPRIAAGLAAAAALIITVKVVGSLNSDRPNATLQIALSDLDAAAGPYRKFEPRLTITVTHRELEPALRSAAPAGEAPLAVREAALQVEKAARASGSGVEGQRALGAMYLTLGLAQRAADVLAPLAQSDDAGLLSDVAAAYLARAADGDGKYALDLLERAVSLDPNRAEAWFNLGLAAQAVGQPARATEAWTRALALDPTSGWADEARGHLEKLKHRGRLPRDLR